MFTGHHAFDATGDERKDQEVGIARFSTGPIKVTCAGLQFHLSDNCLVSAPDIEGVQV
jgi:hypothetical protein